MICTHEFFFKSSSPNTPFKSEEIQLFSRKSTAHEKQCSLVLNFNFTLSSISLPQSDVLEIIVPWVKSSLISPTLRKPLGVPAHAHSLISTCTHENQKSKKKENTRVPPDSFLFSKNDLSTSMTGAPRVNHSDDFPAMASRPSVFRFSVDGVFSIALENKAKEKRMNFSQRSEKFFAERELGKQTDTGK